MKDFELFFRRNNAVMLLLDVASGKIIDANDSALAFYGFSYQALCSMHIADINTDPVDPFTIHRNGNAYYKHRTAYNSIRDVQACTSAVQIKGVLYHFTIIHDITGIKKMEYELADVKEKLELAMDQSHLTYWEMNAANRTFTFNDRFYALYETTAEKEGGYQMPAEVYAREFLPAEEAHLVNDTIEQMLSQETRVLNLQHIIKTRTGKVKYIDVRMNSLVNEKGEVYRVYGSNQDYTEHKLVEIALQKSEAKYRHLVSEMTIGILVHGPGRQIILNNPKALELLDLTQDQLLGLTAYSPRWNVIHEDGSNFPGYDHPVSVACKTKKLVKDIVMGVYRPRKKDRVWLLVTAIPELAADGALLQVVVTFYDITEKRKKEAEVIKLNKELQVLSGYLQKVRSDERNKLATEVHDKIGQRLVGLKFEIEHLKKDRPDLATKTESLSEGVAEMLNDFRMIYNKVNPSLIKDLLLYEIADSQINDFNRRHHYMVRFSSNTENKIFDYNIKLAVHKVISEMLNNLERHPEVTQVSISLMRKGHLLNLVIKDDGLGHDISELSYNEQLSTIEMRELVHAVGGFFSFRTVRRSGTTIRVTVPVFP